MLINGSVSYEVVVTYQALGTTFQRTAILVNAPEWQMSMRFTAEKRDFDPLARAFVGSMRSWQWNEPKSPQLAAN